MEFPELIDHVAITLTSDHLFEIHQDDKCCHLNEEMADAFHQTVTQLQFLTMCLRQDIHMVVNYPIEYDWKK